MILLALITTVVVGPIAYFLSPGKSTRGRLMWTAVVVTTACTAGMLLSIYLGEWLGAD